MVPFEVSDDEPRPRVQRVTLHGELDLASAYAFDRLLLSVEQRRPDVIIVDLRELTMLDSAGLARLVSAQRRARRGGWRLVLVKGGKAIRACCRRRSSSSTSTSRATCPPPSASPTAATEPYPVAAGVVAGTRRGDSQPTGPVSHTSGARAEADAGKSSEAPLSGDRRGVHDLAP